jgi:thymidine kinase
MSLPPKKNKKKMQGTIRLITGPMCSSKTKTLLEMYEREPARKLLVSYQDSHGRGGVWSRAGLFAAGLISESLPLEVDACWVFVDEGQFYANLADFCLELAARGSHVVVAALDTDYLRRGWPSVESLRPHCHVVQQLTAVCACGDAALWSARAGCSEELIDLESEYVPACTRCWEKINIKKRGCVAAPSR